MANKIFRALMVIGGIVFILFLIVSSYLGYMMVNLDEKITNITQNCDQTPKEYPLASFDNAAVGKDCEKNSSEHFFKNGSADAMDLNMYCKCISAQLDHISQIVDQQKLDQCAENQFWLYGQKQCEGLAKK